MGMLAAIVGVVVVIVKCGTNNPEYDRRYYLLQL